MALIDAFRAGVSVANKVTKAGGLQGKVEYHRYTGQTGTGARTYAPPLTDHSVTLDALVDLKQRSVKNQQGDLDICSATLTFLDVQQLATVTGGNGIASEDYLVLPNGKTGPILNFGGFMDTGTSQPLATEVYLG